MQDARHKLIILSVENNDAGMIVTATIPDGILDNHQSRLERLNKKRDRDIEQSEFHLCCSLDFDLLAHLRQVKEINYEYSQNKEKITMQEAP